MAQPTSSQVHVNAVLTNISIAYQQSMNNFVASKVFPIVPVVKQTDIYYSYNKNDWLRDEMQVRPPGTESAGSGYGVNTNTYSCTKWALHKDIDDDTRANADNPLNMDRDATNFLTMRKMIRMENQWTADYFTTGVWANDVTPGNLWSAYASSDPIQDIETGKTTVLSNTGFEPNTLVLGYEVFSQLKNHPDLVDRFKYTTSEVVTAQIMARLFDLDNVYVAKSVKATNVEGETAAYAFSHGKHALLCHVAQTPGLLAPSAGYTFEWTGVAGDLGEATAIKTFRMEHLESDRVEIQAAWDNKVVASDLGYFFNGAVA